LNQQDFREYLLKNDVKKEQVELFIDKLINFEEFLHNEGENINTFPEGKLTQYTEVLVNKEEEEEAILDLLRAVINYANFTKKYDYIIEVIDIVEGYNAMDNLHTRIAEQLTEDIRDEVFKDLTIPVLGEHPDKKPRHELQLHLFEDMALNLDPEQKLSCLTLGVSRLPLRALLL